MHHEHDMTRVETEIRQLREEIMKLWAEGLRQLGERVATVEASTRAAHKRIDSMEGDLAEASKQVTALTVRLARVVALLTALGVLVNALVTKYNILDQLHP